MGFRDFSINRKITVITMLSSILALVVACGCFMAYDLATFRAAMVSEATTQAEIVGNNLTAAMAFGDKKEAERTLASLRAQTSIRAAGVFTADGTLFASYAREGEAAFGELRPGPDGGEFREGRLDLSWPIELEGIRIGTIHVQRELTILHARIRRYLEITAVVLGASVAVAYLLLTRLKRLISEPVLHLAQTARTISMSQNYALRANKESNDELGSLIECFNEMLCQIQQRDRELEMHRDHLEEKVQQRTEELRTVNAQLLEEKQNAEAANRAKSAFLANMSHEIRTPMTAILGYADVMLEPDQTMSDRQDSLQVIRRNARHLMDLINDILDISKIEAGKMSAERLPCDLAQIVSDVTSTVRPRAIERALAFQVVCDTPVPRQISTDALRLRQILMNTLGNAIKFTHQGGITLRIACERHDGNTTLRFAVEDTGIGVAPDQIDRLFQPFSQADESMTRRYGGTGLGLIISQRLAVLLGGGIEVRSQPGVGSTFTISIDAGPVQGDQMIQDLKTDLLDLKHVENQTWSQRLHGRILLAEDGPDNQLLISSILRRTGAEVVIAENGKAAVQLARSQAFDLVLMDMQMPQMDGYAATSELRRRGMDLPIVALTAHAMVGDREKCLKAGCTDYLSKPIDKGQLLRVVNSYLVEAQKARAAATGAGAEIEARDLQAMASSADGKLHSTLKNDPDVRDILEQFVGRMPHRVSRLRECLEKRDYEELGRLVHQLKGASAGFGFGQISTVAARVEQRIRTHTAHEMIVAAVRELIDVLRSVEGYDEAGADRTEDAGKAAA